MCHSAFSFPLSLRAALVAALASLPLGLLAPAAGAASTHPSSSAARAGSAAAAARSAASRPASTTPAPVTPNGLAATPPMGWNDWYSFTCNVNEQLVEQSAQAMVTSGMKAAGYQYVNIDDCWLAKQRDANGNLQADPAKFPDGIKAVADYVHSLGLKLGIYEDVGTATCAGYPGSYGHDQQDADTFASWGVDFLKVDWCNVPFGDFPGKTQQQVAQQLYTQYSQALQASGRPILFSICEWNPSLKPWTWAPQLGNMWRSNNDYGDSWGQVLANLDQEAPLAQYAGPGHWNDPDILQVGRGGMTTAEDQAHFSAWSMLSAPLLAGNDLRNMSAATKAILTNREVIAIDQDQLGAEATRLSQNGNADVWVKRLANGDRAVMLLNRGSTPLNISTTAQAAGLPNAGAYAVRDVWAHTTRESAGTIAASVPPDSAMLYRVSPLNAEVDQYAPVTDVSVTPQVPAAYPGSQFQVAQPGQTITVPASFRNDGRAAVTDASLSLAAPGGWSVSGATVSAGAVPTGNQLNSSWQVTIPPGTAAGSYTLTGNAAYRWSDGTQSATNSGQGSFQVLVPPTGTPYLDQLKWLSATSSFDGVLTDANYYGGPLTIHGTQYSHGLWANSIASVNYYLGANCSNFTADLGLDDSDAGHGTVDYQLYADGTKVYDSGVVTNSTPTVHANVDVSGAHILQLYVGDAGDGISYDNADVGNPQLTCNKPLTLSAPSIVSPGANASAKTSIHNSTAQPLSNVSTTLDGPSGWTATATSPSSFATIAPGQTATTTWNVAVPANAQSGTYPLNAGATFTSAGRQESASDSAQLNIPYASLSASFGNTGISPDSNQACADLDGDGYSLSADALAKAGVSPGSTLTSGGATFTWPNAPACQPDNVLAAGQAIQLPQHPSTSALGFLATSTNGASTGSVTISYTDGSTATAPLIVSDWAKAPYSGENTAVTTGYRNSASGSPQQLNVRVFEVNVPTDPTKAVAAVTLPDISDHVGTGVTALHVFGIAAK